MALVPSNLLFGPEMLPPDEPNNEGTCAEDGDDMAISRQSANNNSWLPDEIQMADATGTLASVAFDFAGRGDASSSLTELDSDDEMGEIESKPEERAVTPKSDDGIDKLDKYAFNFQRVAYDHQVPPPLTTGIQLNVAKVHPHITLAQHRQKRPETGKEEECPPLLPSEVETQKSFNDCVKCVWVGILPGQASKQRQGSAMPAQSSVGTGAVHENDTPKKPTRKRVIIHGSVMEMAEEDMAVVPVDKNALRVVARMPTRAIKKWRLYALVRDSSQSSVLCQGYAVALDDVYFFRAFRDDRAMSFQPRKQATQELIRVKMFSALPSPAPTNPPVGAGEGTTNALPTTPASLGPHVDSRPRSSSLTSPVGDAVAAAATSEDDESLAAILKHILPKNQKRKSVCFQDTEGELCNKRVRAATEPVTTGSAVTESHEGGDDGQATAGGNEVKELTQKIMKVVNGLAANPDVPALEHALVLLESLDSGTRPSGSSVLGLCLNIPAEGDIKSHIDMEKLLVSQAPMDSVPSPPGAQNNSN